MEQYLQRLIREAASRGQPALTQIRFKPGGIAMAGALREGPAQGLYTLSTLVPADPQMAAGLAGAEVKVGDPVVIESTFQADAIQDILVFKKPGPSSGIVIPKIVPPNGRGR